MMQVLQNLCSQDPEQNSAVMVRARQEANLAEQAVARCRSEYSDQLGLAQREVPRLQRRPQPERTLLRGKPLREDGGHGARTARTSPREHAHRHGALKSRAKKMRVAYASGLPPKLKLSDPRKSSVRQRRDRRHVKHATKWPRCKRQQPSRPSEKRNCRTGFTV